jgi:hypothetical protein
MVLNWIFVLLLSIFSIYGAYEYQPFYSINLDDKQGENDFTINWELFGSAQVLTRSQAQRNKEDEDKINGITNYGYHKPLENPEQRILELTAQKKSLKGSAWSRQVCSYFLFLILQCEGKFFTKVKKLPYKICIKFDTFEKFALTLLYILIIRKFSFHQSTTSSM